MADTAAVLCIHCGDDNTVPHCANPQCTWIACLKCRKPSVIPKPHEEAT